jgi:hypothetical protein
MQATDGKPIMLRILALSAYSPLVNAASIPAHILVLRAHTALALTSCRTGPGGAYSLLIVELAKYLQGACPEAWALFWAEGRNSSQRIPRLPDGVLVLKFLQTAVGPLPYIQLDVYQLEKRAVQAAVSSRDQQALAGAAALQLFHW